MAADRARLQGRLLEGAAALDVSLDAGAADRLVDFLFLLQRWNRYYNLTAVDDPEAMIAAHLLDSLALLPQLGDGPVIDVGTGAGLPGLVLALGDPDRHYVLLDRTAKKIRFVTQAIAHLGLTRTQAVQSRVETYRPEAHPGTVVARAFAAVPETLAAVRGLVGPATRVLLPKGRYPAGELEGVPPDFQVIGVERLQIPALAAERHLVIAACAGDRSTEH